MTTTGHGRPPRPAPSLPNPAAGVHALDADDVVQLLHSDAQRGLAEPEAAARLSAYGPNSLPDARGAGRLLRLLRQFHNPLVYVLLVAGAVTAALREYVDSSVIFGVVLVNALVGYLQESKAEAALDGLRSLVRTSARVLRAGQERTVTSDELVPGDVVLLEAGDKVPADLRLIRSVELRVDESATSGESVPVEKDATVVLPGATPMADRCTMAYSGTLVTAGGATGVVVATGARTELGEIHRLVGTATRLRTPLTRKISDFSRGLTFVILLLAAVTFGVGVLRGQDAAEVFTAAVALAVGAIPEGLPAALTITLAIGVSRMARRRAVVRRLPAVETLGSTTVICTDKTGTLTENQMTVRAIWTPQGDYSVTGSGYASEGELSHAEGRPADPRSDAALRWSLLAGAACNDAVLGDRDGRVDVIGDPTEAALLVVATKARLGEEVAIGLPRLATVPFASERQYMGTLHRDLTAGDESAQVVLVKGAVERVVELCTAQLGADGIERDLQRAEVLGVADELAGGGLRVLATAVRRHPGPGGVDADRLLHEVVRGGFVLTGLVAMLDPPRAAAVSAVAACRAAGLEVKMITGDHAATAAAIASRVGLLEPGQPRPGEVLTGMELAALDGSQMPEAVNRASVLARVSPAQKLSLVEALQAGGHVVAMTGDGVNDAPALRRADIGVAMGATGTEVAKDASDIVLTDDDFATIEAAVEEGRAVFDNLTKFIAWTLPTNIGEGLVILVAILVGTALPILPTQILWINMTTAVALGLMLAFEPKEAGIMSRPPRDPRQPLLTAALMLRILLVSALLVAGSWWLFLWEQSQGASLAEARTAALNLFVVVEAFYLFSCRSLTRSAWHVGFFSNRWLIVGVAVQAVGQLGITYLPTMNAILHTEPLGALTWLRILGIAVVVSLVVAVEKRVRREASSPAASVPAE